MAPLQGLHQGPQVTDGSGKSMLYHVQAEQLPGAAERGGRRSACPLL